MLYDVLIMCVYLRRTSMSSSAVTHALWEGEANIIRKIALSTCTLFLPFLTTRYPFDSNHMHAPPKFQPTFLCLANVSQLLLRQVHNFLLFKCV